MTDSELQSLKSKIEGMQSMMIAYVTDQRDAVQPNAYRDLYFQTAVELEALGYVNPNPHTSLETFWSYCKLKELNSYATRRSYVRDLYADILLDIERALRRAKDPQHWKQANEELVDALTPIRQQWLKAKNYIYSTPPDFENSIKESINSIESTLKVLTGDSKSTLGQIIKQIDIDTDIGKLLSQAYGLVSNKAFVRHGGTEHENLTQQEAEFFVEFAAIAIVYLKNKLRFK
jgi:hypothetical protein